MNDKSTTIITADYMYLVFVGSEDLIIKIINKLNQNQAHKNTLFISHNIDIPCVNLLDNDTLKNIFKNNYLSFDEGIETAQCLVYAEYPKQNLMCMFSITKTETNNIISFPVLSIDDEENPDKIIGNWLKKYNIDKVINSITIKPIDIVGGEHDILVFVAYINN
jgi:hypothetical protein|uniref:Uncharacterized protein n=1 Tax=viral metagenome TaxID=1070528 RepID=A0A6C0DX50_9ZZZZ